MKMIKEGVEIPKMYRATCEKCSAVWEAEPAEVEGFHRNAHVIYTKTCDWCGCYGLLFELHREAK